MDDVAGPLAGKLGDRLDLWVAPDRFRHLRHQPLHGLAHLLHLQRLVGDGARAAGVLDVLLPARHLHQVVGQSALCRPQVDLKGQGVAPRLAVEDPRKRRVRHRAAVPVVLAIDLHGGKAGRQGAGGHEVVRPQPALGAVEIDQVAAAHVHRGDALIEMPASQVGRIPASCRPS